MSEDQMRAAIKALKARVAELESRQAKAADWLSVAGQRIKLRPKAPYGTPFQRGDIE